LTLPLETRIAEGRGRQIGRNILSSYAGQTVSIITPLVLIPLYTRLLGHAVYGQWLMIQSVAVYLGLGNFGTAQSVGNRITESVAGGKREELGQTVSTAFIGYGMVAVVLAIVCAGSAHWIFHDVSAEGDAHVALAFVILTIMLLSSWPLRMGALVLRGFERVDQDQAVSAGSSILRLIGTAAVLYGGMKLVGVALVQGGTTLLYGLGVSILAARFTPEARPRIARFSRRILRSLAKPSLSFFIMDASATLNFSVDNLVIGYVLGTTMVTAYSVPYRMLLTLGGLFSVLDNALRPTLTTRFVRGERDMLYSGLTMLLRIAFLYVTLVAFVAWLIGPEVLRVWAGAGVFPGKYVFGMQIAVFMMSVLIDPPLTVLYATTRHYGFAKFALTEGLLNLVLSLWWVRYWGLGGVIGSTMVARVLTTLWYTPWAAFGLLDNGFERVFRDLWPAAAICTGSIASAVFLDRLANGNRALLIGSSVAGVVLIIAIFALGAFTAPERRAAWSWITGRSAAPA
jgi:O-antigen/teichoic acid export membrane protein